MFVDLFKAHVCVSQVTTAEAFHSLIYSRDLELMFRTESRVSELKFVLQIIINCW